jgi:mRNA-degrading endonuclease toxin of MazEF toxin-antitoxin module
MAPWEIWSYDFDVEGAHPVVIFSNAARVSNAGLEQVNVLFCTTLRREEQRAPKPHEVILDAADGLDWATRCRCDALHFVPKTQLRAKRGLVSWERRRAISEKILRFFPFAF